MELIGVSRAIGAARGGRARLGRLGAAILAAAPADGDVPQRAAFGPVSAAALAEVAGLREAVVVVVAELCVRRSAARTVWSDLNDGFPLLLYFH